MIARMPELSLSEISVSEKPSSESISSWVRMRSAPPFAAWMKWPSSTMVAHCAAMASAPPSPSLSLSRGRCGILAGCCLLLGFERDAPFGSKRVLVDLILGHSLRLGSIDQRKTHWTTISLNNTALIRLGAIAALTRRVSSSLRR